MNLSDLKRYDLLYVGTPYSKYEGGIDAAFVDACKLMARLLTAGLKVFGPIPHTHPIAIHGGIDPLDHSIWLPFDGWIMAKADALVVAMMPGWEESEGIKTEILTFADAARSIYLLDPDHLFVWRCAAERVEKIRRERSAA